MVEAKIRDLEAGPALATPLAAEARPEGDRLAGVWEDPFEPAIKTEVTPSEIPQPVKSEEPAPLAAVAADSSGGEQPSAKQAAPAPAPVLAPATPPAPAAPLVQTGNGPASEAAAKPAATRWWLWTGIGAVVTAGVVTAVILLTRSSQRDGTCPSGFDGCLAVGK